MRKAADPALGCHPARDVLHRKRLATDRVVVLFSHQPDATLTK
jgi:hypothetical protein